VRTKGCPKCGTPQPAPSTQKEKRSTCRLWPTGNPPFKVVVPQTAQPAPELLQDDEKRNIDEDLDDLIALLQFRLIESRTLRLQYGIVHAEEVAKLRAELEQWQKAMHDLTAGGSEFVRDLDRCVKYIKDRQLSQMEITRKTVIDRKKAEAALAAAQERQQELQDEIQGYREAMNCVPTDRLPTTPDTEEPPCSD